MDSIEIKRPIVVKIIMTLEFKEQLINETVNTINQISENIKHIETIHDSHADTKNEEPQSKSPFQGGQMGLDQLKQLKQELEWKIKEFEAVKEGAELPFRVFEGSVQLKIGDNFLSKMAKAEVVVKNWKVVEIREG
ncbi:MAG: hypothetical protein HYU63_01170 [Armatimonadetes bacterium]|nr:hypothetical protein [Armatimonadota bacterium]